MEEKVLKYETFLNETLRQQLKDVLDRRDKVYGQINEYLQLKTVMENLQNDGADKRPLKTKVDLGCNFYVQANVPDPSNIFVCIGLGIFLEFTFEEAQRFIDKKTAFLTDQTDKLTEAACRVRAHIKLVLEALREVQHINQEEDKKWRDIFLKQ